MAEFEYAQDCASGQYIRIGDLARGEDRAYRCIACEAPMMPVLGSIREHHFRHYHKTSCSPGGEGYLHRLAKNRFMNAWLNSSPSDNLTITTRAERDHRCPRCLGLWKEMVKIVRNFTVSDYPEAELEPSCGPYRPDCRLSGVGTLDIEFHVSHRKRPEDMDTRPPTIEITVLSERAVNELCTLTWEHMDVRYYNLPALPEIEKVCTVCSHPRRAPLSMPIPLPDHSRFGDYSINRRLPKGVYICGPYEGGSVKLYQHGSPTSQFNTFTEAVAYLIGRGFLT